ncbi:MAG: UDP-N-acetylmuramoyl-tripeptide--D-alanyl-D-alanine ligase [Betaproteobacteria bacterium]
MLTLADLARAIPQATLHGDGGLRVERVSTDTRTLAPGALFFALRGPSFDAHDFIVQAVAGGAGALVVERLVDAPLPQLVVPDARRALGLAAAVWRAPFALPLAVVTGSNGKTTVTQMVAAILAAAYGAGKRLATRGNLNNDVGLPLMLFDLHAQHRAAVLELGMNHAGEIAWLAQLARPTVALVNNAQREHQEFLDGIEATARENAEAIAALPPDGVAVFPADDACAGIWRQAAGTRRVLDFACHGQAAVTASYRLRPEDSELFVATPQGEIELRLPLAGEHNVHNALAATATALALGVPLAAIREGLANFAPVAGRGVRLRTAAGALLIDDSYNANPDSVRAAIDQLAACPAPRVLVLGDMGEVGTQGPEFHREIGAYARAAGIEALLALGNATRATVAAFGAGARHYDAVEPLAHDAAQLAGSGGTVLVKGSRFMKMERVIRALTATEEEEAAHG